MGTVYLGRHETSDRVAAVKVLPGSMVHESGFVSRFNREIAAMRKLQSPNIVELYDSGEDHGTYFYAMEYVSGETLTDRILREKRIPWREAIEISVQICRALKSAHNAGIIHRDLKPSNLLMGEDGTVKLTDFGIAQVFASSKLTVTGGILGTAEYMSPEQAQGRRTTKQSDLYSLGAVLYVMLTGRPPFIGKTTLEILQKHRFSQFDSPKRVVPDIPFWLDEIVCRCLSKKPEDRYPDAYVLSLRLQEVPKKVDLARDTTPVPEGANSTSETLVDAPEGEADQVGGTLIRDLFRAQMEAEQASSGIGKLLDNVWVLIGLLVLIIAGAYGLSQLNRSDPEELLARGTWLMSQPEGPAWLSAKRECFEPLLELDAERWEPEVAPFLKQIDLYEFKQQILGRESSRIQIPESEPEAIIRQSLELMQSGRIGEATTRLLALKQITQDNAEYVTFHDLADHLLERISQTAQRDRLEYIDQALARADELVAQGKPDRARDIWQSVIDLYDADQTVREAVQIARERLQSFPVSP